MPVLPGVYTAEKKNGDLYYRASITYKSKHISLGSYTNREIANLAYQQAADILVHKIHEIDDHDQHKYALSFSKWVALINYRDNGIYIKTPIYLHRRHFDYYLTPELVFKFDTDDLFYYSTHTIMRRGGYLFVADYGMQVNILSRYGIKNFSVPGRDFRFVNGDDTDYRYNNIEVINKYYGVQKKNKNGKISYQVRIHIIGDTVVGNYSTESAAAVAYNRAADILKKNGCSKIFPRNYVEEINEIEYAKLYNSTRINEKIRNWNPNNS